MITRNPKGNDAHLSAIINLKGLIRCSRAANSTVSGPIWLKFEHNQNIMYVLITCKFKKYLNNSNQEKVETTIFQTLKGSLLKVMVRSRRK